jgi:hypothetical protein
MQENWRAKGGKRRASYGRRRQNVDANVDQVWGHAIVVGDTEVRPGWLPTGIQVAGRGVADGRARYGGSRDEQTSAGIPLPGPGL